MATGWLVHELYMWHDTGRAALWHPAGLTVEPDLNAENSDTKRRFRNLLDVAGLRKHLKKLHTTTAYLQLYCRWNYYRPHPATQLVFHNSKADERSNSIALAKSSKLMKTWRR